MYDSETCGAYRPREQYKIYFYQRNLATNQFDFLQNQKKTEDDERITKRIMAQILTLEADLRDI